MDHQPVADSSFIIMVYILTLVLFLSYTLLNCVSDRGKRAILKALQLTGLNITWFSIMFIVLWILNLFFFTGMGLLTQVDSDMPDVIIENEHSLRWLSILCFYCSALLFPIVVLLIDNNFLYKWVIICPILLTWMFHILIIIVYYFQITTRTDSDCECWVRNVAISGFICGIISHVLFVYDIVYGVVYIVNNQGTSLEYMDISESGRYVEQKIELGVPEEASI